VSASEPFSKARSGSFVGAFLCYQKGGVNPFFWTADLTGLLSLPDPFKDFVMGTGLADHDVPSDSAQTAQKYSVDLLGPGLTRLFFLKWTFSREHRSLV